VFMENVSHGQLQSLSAVATENLVDGDKPPVYVCMPPQLMEGKGMTRKFEGDRVLIVPAHSGKSSSLTFLLLFITILSITFLMFYFCSLRCCCKSIVDLFNCNTKLN
jgi:hypothetical protein